MLISCIGDSLTEGDYGVAGKRGIANVHPENYPYFLQKELGCTAQNFGRCGFTATRYLNYYKTGAVTVLNSNIIIVLLGTNGGLSPSPNEPENKDYLELLTLLQHDAPNAKIVLCTPPHCTENPAYSNCGHKDRVEKAVAFVREFARANRYPLIDLAASPEFTAETEAIMQPNDGLHFGKVGYQTLAHLIAAGLKNNGLV